MSMSEKHHGMLNELLDVESGLTDWEIEFLDNVNGFRGELTGRQAIKLEEIWEKIFVREDHD
jgi:hypothetical protein